MIGGPSDNGLGTPGWYDLSTVVRGRLHPFIRCEHDADWCGDVLSVAWARDGTRLAYSVTSFAGTPSSTASTSSLFGPDGTSGRRFRGGVGS